MSEPCIVAIAAADRLPQLKARIGEVSGELLAFTDADALRALETIVTRKPTMVALERLFAASPRGAALIQRIKSDKKLRGSEIRVFAHDSDVVRVVPRPDAAPAEALDQTGTRRAPRFKMDTTATALVDGKTAALIDLSAIGALVDQDGKVAFTAKVAWTSFESLPGGGARFRAGVEFVDADAARVDAFSERHKTA